MPKTDPGHECKITLERALSIVRRCSEYLVSQRDVPGYLGGVMDMMVMIEAELQYGPARSTVQKTKLEVE